MRHAGESLALGVRPIRARSSENGIQGTDRIAYVLKPHNPIDHGIRFVEHRGQPVCRFQCYRALTLLGEVESCRSAQGASDGLVPLRCVPRINPQAHDVLIPTLTVGIWNICAHTEVRRSVRPVGSGIEANDRIVLPSPQRMPGGPKDSRVQVPPN